MEIAVGVAVTAAIELAKLIAEKIHTHQAQLADLKEHLRHGLLDTQAGRLTADFNNAHAIALEPTVELQQKQTLNHAFGQAKKRLETLESELEDYLSPKSRNPLKNIKRISSGQLSDTARDVGKTLDAFHNLVMSMSVGSPGAATFLNDDAFIFVVNWEQTRIWLTETTFIAEASLTRNVNGVAAGLHKFIVELREYKSQDKESIRTDMILLNQRLTAAAPDDGIAPVLGFRDDRASDHSGSFQLISTLREDPGVEGVPTTLDKFMRRNVNMISLNTRIKLCADLASAVLHVHRAGLVHKNIRPENILLVPDPQSSRVSAGRLVLVGWQYAREAQSFKTNRAGEQTWHRRVYQHPERQGLRARAPYHMDHDIYSLGVCMLEMLLWKPLIVLMNGQRELSGQFADFFRSEIQKGGSMQVPPGFNTAAEWMTSQPLDIKKVLLAMTIDVLPLAGSRMQKAVQECLDGKIEETVKSDAAVPDEADNDLANRTEVQLAFATTILNAIRAVAAAI